MAQPVLVTLTAPSNAGKSYLFNYIRDQAKLPCLISTTTRPARDGEIDGVDYFFITDEESRAIEEQDNFAELMVYNGYRYGVTKEEFSAKLSNGLAFLIVEPTGLDHYVEPALEVGAMNLKVFIDVAEPARIRRMQARLNADLKLLDAPSFDSAHVKKLVNVHFTRLVTMLTTERNWKDLHEWDLVLSGIDSPQHNIQRILEQVQLLKEDSKLNHV